MQVEFEEQVSRGNASGGWRVASYARLSKEDDLVGESDSILGQREIIRSWAEMANKPDWYHQSTNLGTANQLTWYRA